MVFRLMDYKKIIINAVIIALIAMTSSFLAIQNLEAAGTTAIISAVLSGLLAGLISFKKEWDDINKKQEEERAEKKNLLNKKGECFYDKIFLF